MGFCAIDSRHQRHVDLAIGFTCGTADCMDDLLARLLELRKIMAAAQRFALLLFPCVEEQLLVFRNDRALDLHVCIAPGL